MRLVRYSAAGLILLCALSAPTARADGKWETYGGGTYSCGAWVNNRANEQRDAISASNVFGIMQWLEGWISARGFYESHFPPGRQSLKVVDAESMEVWLDNYCKKNPLRKVQDGAMQLAIELEQ